MAALTDRIKLGTSVIDGLLHPPVVLARRFATLDQFSGGRVIAGLGQGWMPQEFETANVPITREPLGQKRPFLGGSPGQIAEDLARLEPAGVDHVLFADQAASDLDEEVRLLEELQAAVAARA